MPVSPQLISHSGVRAGAFSVILDPILDHILNPSPATPSVIRPNVQNSIPTTPLMVDAVPNPCPPAVTIHKFPSAAIPKAQTTAGLPGPHVQFAVRVPSPQVLETPTPVDMSKRLGYVHSARQIRSAGISMDVHSHPAGLREGKIRILATIPDPLSEVPGFRTFARSLTWESVPEISDLHPPARPAIHQPLQPADQTREIANSFLPLTVQQFPMGPAILERTTLDEGVLPTKGPVTRSIRPDPDSPEFVHFGNRPEAEPAWRFELANPVGASFVACARPVNGSAGDVVVPEFTHRPWSRREESASAEKTIPQPSRVAPELAPFRKIARPESMNSSFANDLRDRLFNPLIPIPRTDLGTVRLETTNSKLRESHSFVPLDFRWQRKRKAWDRGASWKPPAAILSLPTCVLPQWPGPLLDGQRYAN